MGTVFGLLGLGGRHLLVKIELDVHESEVFLGSGMKL